jgi:hypothetical protein
MAYTEFIAPKLLDGAEEAVGDGKQELLAAPLFSAAATHLAEDISAQVWQRRKGAIRNCKSSSCPDWGASCCKFIFRGDCLRVRWRVKLSRFKT